MEVENININEEMSQGELLLALYKGAINFCQEANQALTKEDTELFTEKVKRVQAIINELMVTLDMEQGGEIAENLYNLYEYMNRRLIQANIRKDSKIVLEVQELLQDLKEGWEQAAQQLE